MTSRNIYLLTFSFLFFSSVFAARIPIDKAMPAISINDTSQLGILNSRMGSRFSLNFFSGKRGIHTGALGFDSDEYSELLVGVEQDGKLEIFRLANPLIKSNYLQNQTLQLAMTGMQLKGTSSKGLEVSVTAVSPFTPAKTFLLVDENQRPYFYLLEGRFKHQSTVDEAHETELVALFNPWRLKMQLQQWTNLLKTTYEKAYPLFTKSYGITLTSAETPTWYSKIMVSDIVEQRWFGSTNNSVHFVYQHNVNSPFTYNDGMENESRSWIGYFYPRGVVTLGYFMNELKFSTKGKEEFLKDLK